MESIGVLLKEEMLQTVEHFIVENSFVLENIEPFPGYHGENFPETDTPDSLFLITNKHYDMERIFRISQHLCCDKVYVDACPVEISLNSAVYHGIRIRGMKGYQYTPNIQKCYLEKDIEFMKKKDVKENGLIRLIKFFSLDKISDQIYRDMEDQKTFYLCIPYHFHWEEFRNVTSYVKNNLENRNFDAASGFFYQRNMIEFVRIYTQNPDMKRLLQIREKYLEEIKKKRDDAQ